MGDLTFEFSRSVRRRLKRIVSHALRHLFQSFDHGKQFFWVETELGSF